VPTIKQLASSELAAASQADWDRVRATTDQEISQQIASDPDTAPDMSDVDNGVTWHVVHKPPVPDVGRIRAKLGLSQAAFAARFGLRVRTIQEWEQGRSVPDQPARVLLMVIDQAPHTVEHVVHASSRV
jgi:putative transcriptional regulator